MSDLPIANVTPSVGIEEVDQIIRSFITTPTPLAYHLQCLSEFAPPFHPLLTPGTKAVIYSGPPGLHSPSRRRCRSCDKCLGILLPNPHRTNTEPIPQCIDCHISVHKRVDNRDNSNTNNNTSDEDEELATLRRQAARRGLDVGELIEQRAEAAEQERKQAERTLAGLLLQRFRDNVLSTMPPEIRNNAGTSPIHTNTIMNISMLLLSATGEGRKQHQKPVVKHFGRMIELEP